MKEFTLIDTYFANLLPSVPSLILGVGDDAAVWEPTPNKQQIFTVDTLHAGCHFLPEDPPDTVGHKALAVSLSDCAAMGARPVGFLLSLSLPRIDETWVKNFSLGLKALASQYDLALLGGDTTQGPLSISLTLMGEVEPGNFLTRAGAQVQDDIYVSGTLGLPRLGLELLQGNQYIPEADYDLIVKAYRQPQPQLSLGQALIGLATSCIDISDGFAADLGHILEKSHCGAQVQVETLPLHHLLKEYVEADRALDWALTAGDDYQLIFTVPPSRRDEVKAISERLNLPLTRVGIITPGTELIAHRANGQRFDLGSKGWEHFSNE